MSHFSESFLEELRARLPVSEVVGKRVKLRKQGREFIGLSPFNAEKSPSFTVNDQKGFYHDFSSGKHGDIFSFVMETEGLSFPETVERLASLAGLPLPATSEQSRAQENRRKTLVEVLELAARFYEERLRSSLGKEAREYLEGRGLRRETLKEFRIGYAPTDRSALKGYLASHGVPIPDMIDAGLLISGPDVPVPFDRFRDRVIIPIQDRQGRVIGFGGRALSSEVQPKYLNSPETDLFHKGSLVFNFHRARQAAHDTGSVVAVEGYMDAISLFQAGFKAVVATLGTALTEHQIELLWRMSEDPIICFDGDRPGIAAAHRSVDRALPVLRVGRTLRFAFLKDSKDPDVLVREKGLPAFEEILREAQPIWGVLWDREVAPARVDTPDAQAALEHRLNELVNTIKDREIANAYRQAVRIRLSKLFWVATRGEVVASGKGLAKHELRFLGDERKVALQKIILGMVVEYVAHPDVIWDHWESIVALDMSRPLSDFRGALHDLLETYKDIDVARVYQRLPKRFYETLDEVHGDEGAGRRRGHKLYARFPALAVNPPIDFIVRCLEHFIDTLELDQVREHLTEMAKAVTGGEDFEAESFRLLHAKREYDDRLSRNQSLDVDLSRELVAMRRPGMRDSDRSQLLAA